MVARRVLGLQGSAQPGSRRRPSAPKASAVRHKVPRFPGSWRPSSTKYRLPVSSSGRARAGRRARKRTCWGVSVGATDRSRSPGTSTWRTPWGIPAGGWVPVCHRMVSSPAPHRRASASILGPSHTMTPSRRRYFRSPVSLRMRVMRGLVLLVILSIAPPTASWAGNATTYRQNPCRYAVLLIFPWDGAPGTRHTACAWTPPDRLPRSGMAVRFDKITDLVIRGIIQRQL